MMKKLTAYRKKRKFTETPEPIGKQRKEEKGESKKKKLAETGTFVIQRHASRRLHFDFRIKSGGVLKSWAVPNGMPLTANDKRLAVPTEDHPLEYEKFEGRIPKGHYGAGEVKIWDRGKYENKTTKYKSLEEGIMKGHFLLKLNGKYVRGPYGFSKTKQNWILVKKKEFKQKEYPENAEVIIGKRKINLTNLAKTIFKNLRKGDLVEYYGKVSKLMLKHLADRPISMFRFPDGVGEETFFQKKVPEYFPKWIKTKVIKHKSGATKYVICIDKPTLIFLANQVMVPHIWTSKTEKLGYPDRMIFDLDPSKEGRYTTLHQVAFLLKFFLEELGFTPFIMTTGGKGFHIHVPIKEDCSHEEVREFAGKIAEVFASNYPETTAEIMKAHREGRIFIDVNRNSPQQTAVAPYAVRANEKAAIAMPIFWEELDAVEPQTFTLDTVQDRLNVDPWQDFFKRKVSIKKVKKKLKN